MTDQTARQVNKRRVFYIPGFDPFPPRRYREYYRKECAEQGRISGYDITMRGAGSAAWDVDATIEGASVQAHVEVLMWSDIVGSSMDQGIWATYRQLFRTAWIYISTGTLWRLMRLRRGPVIAALYPVVFLLAQLMLAIAVWAGLWWAAAQGGGAPYGIIGLIIGAVAGYGVLAGFRRLDRHVLAYYLMHDYAFSAGELGRYPDLLEHRLSMFRARIAGALADPTLDEVLIVGHSSGAYLGVSILADLMRAGALRDAGPAVGFLSLGQVIPMVSFLPDAGRLRRDLHAICTCADVDWVDVTAMGDGCAFALCDPVAVTGVAPETGQRGPLVFSAAFSRTLGAARWRKDRRAWFRLHFQYLFAFPYPEDYDYFRITAGPMTLGDRFQGRTASPSVKRTAQSKYRSMTP